MVEGAKVNLERRRQRMTSVECGEVVGVGVEVDGCGERGEGEVKCGGVSVTR